MKETVLARIYVDVLGIGKNTDEADSLIRWRRPENTAVWVW